MSHHRMGLSVVIFFIQILQKLILRLKRQTEIFIHPDKILIMLEYEPTEIIMIMKKTPCVCKTEKGDAGESQVS